MSKVQIAHNKMDKKYKYELTEPIGKKFASNFKPFYTPMEMLQMGVFEGKYCRDQHDEFPKSWFKNAVEAKEDADSKLNYFKIKSRQSLQIWIANGWIIGPDNRGWFEWYMRYYMGRRIPEVDDAQIKRHNAIARHYAQVIKNCTHKKLKNGKCSDPMNCRPKQRQTLLQWAWPCLD